MLVSFNYTLLQLLVKQIAIYSFVNIEIICFRLISIYLMFEINMYSLLQIIIF